MADVVVAADAPAIGKWVKLLEPPMWKGIEAEIVEVHPVGAVQVIFMHKDVMRSWTSEVGEFRVIVDPNYTVAPTPEPVSISTYFYGDDAISSRIKNGVYTTTMPYPTREELLSCSEDGARKWKNDYAEQTKALEKLFREDLLIAYKVAQPETEKFYKRFVNLAWDKAHANGYQEVANEFSYYMDLFTGFTVVPEVK